MILGYQKGELAANLHCTTPRQDIRAIRDGRMKVVCEHTPLNPMAYVAVNSSAVTGINAHALLKGYCKPKVVVFYIFGSFTGLLLNIKLMYSNVIMFFVNTLELKQFLTIDDRLNRIQIGTSVTFRAFWRSQQDKTRTFIMFSMT